MVCKYAFFGEAPAALGGAKDAFNPATAINSDRVCRTVPLLSCSIFGEDIFPSTSKNSLRLAYYTHPQSLSVCFPLPRDSAKYKIACPANLCRIVREDDGLDIYLRLPECRFLVAGPEQNANYVDSQRLQDWVLQSSFKKGGELKIACHVMGNSFQEVGSGARLAHQFAEHVVHASSAPPPTTLPSQRYRNRPSKGRDGGQVHKGGRGGGDDGGGGGGGGGVGGGGGGGSGGGARWCSNTYDNKRTEDQGPLDRKRIAEAACRKRKDQPSDDCEEDDHQHRQPHNRRYARNGSESMENRSMVRGPW